MTEEEAKTIIEKVRQTKHKSDDFVSYHIKRMYVEFGGKWDYKRAQEYINAVVAEEDMRELVNYTTEEVDN